MEVPNDESTVGRSKGNLWFAIVDSTISVHFFESEGSSVAFPAVAKVMKSNHPSR